MNALSSALDMMAAALLSTRLGFPTVTFLSALALAIAVIAWRRRAAGKRLHLRPLWRALFPKSFFRGGSGHVDKAFFLLNLCVFGLLFGWAIVSTTLVIEATKASLTSTFGATAPSTWPVWLLSAIVTLVAFLAYELGYWLDHYLSHKVPFLWEFHKVHHAADSLSVLTVFRVHPVDTIVFYNILALVVGFALGVTRWLMGATISDFHVAGSNIIMLACAATYLHLQHSSVWIAFTGIWGRIFLSPAHHQIHHSSNPAHYGHNLGSCLSLFDWAFGTLLLPTRTRQKLTYGVEASDGTAGSIVGSLFWPFARAARLLKPHPRTDATNAPGSGVPSTG